MRRPLPVEQLAAPLVLRVVGVFDLEPSDARVHSGRDAPKLAVRATGIEPVGLTGSSPPVRHRLPVTLTDAPASPLPIEISSRARARLPLLAAPRHPTGSGFPETTGCQQADRTFCLSSSTTAVMPTSAAPARPITELRRLTGSPPRASASHRLTPIRRCAPIPGLH